MPRAELLASASPPPGAAENEEGPFIVALEVAQESADTYSGAWFGELGLAALTVSIATAVRRVVADEEMLPRLGPRSPALWFSR